MAAVTAPPVAPCACHYITASEPLSPQQSHLPIYLAVSIRLLQPGRPLLANLRCQSLVLVSTHLLQPCRPLLGSLMQMPVSPSIKLCSLASLCSAVSDTSLSCWLALIHCSLAVLSSAVSDTSLSCWLALICCSLAVLSSAVSDTSLSYWLALAWPPSPRQSQMPWSRSVNLCSLASLSSAVSDASLSLLVARICCKVLSLLFELCAARLALSHSRRCLNLRSLCSAVSPARPVSFLVPSYAVASHLCSAKIL